MAARPGRNSAILLPLRSFKRLHIPLPATSELHDHFQHRIEREEYGRYGNPTQRVAEQKLAALEGAEDCLLFSSGMAAVTTAMYAVLSHNAHVVVTDDSYRRTRQFLTQMLHRYGIEVSLAPAGDYQAIDGGDPADDRVCSSANHRPILTTASSTWNASPASAGAIA